MGKSVRDLQFIACTVPGTSGEVFFFCFLSSFLKNLSDEPLPLAAIVGGADEAELRADDGL